MKFSNKFKNFFIGVLTINILVMLYALLGGCVQVCDFCGGCHCAVGPKQAVFGFFNIFITSVLSTVGFLLIIWIPALTLLGSIVSSLITLNFNFKSKKTKSNGSHVPEKKIIPSSNKELAIIGYIVSSRNAGVMDDAVIKSRLKDKGGWSDKEIEQAFISSSNQK